MATSAAAGSRGQARLTRRCRPGPGARRVPVRVGPGWACALATGASLPPRWPPSYGASVSLDLGARRYRGLGVSRDPQTAPRYGLSERRLGLTLLNPPPLTIFSAGHAVDDP